MANTAAVRNQISTGLSAYMITISSCDSNLSTVTYSTTTSPSPSDSTVKPKLFCSETDCSASALFHFDSLLNDVLDDEKIDDEVDLADESRASELEDFEDLLKREETRFIRFLDDDIATQLVARRDLYCRRLIQQSCVMRKSDSRTKARNAESTQRK